MQITKENYKELVWDENISDDDYFEFYGTLDFEEKVAFIKFLMADYPDYDEHWIEYYYNFHDTWVEQRAWDQFIDFADFMRTNSPQKYEERFYLIDRYPAFYAIYQKDTELLQRSFAKSVELPEKAIDDSLRSVFALLTINAPFKTYALAIAEKVWKPLAESKVLVGQAERPYVQLLYSQCLEELFDKIEAKENIDWDDFKGQLADINYRFLDNLTLLPDLEISFEHEKIHQDAIYRKEKQVAIFIVAAYDIYTTYHIPVYWIYRTWFDILEFMLLKENAPERENWFEFTPNMIHGLLHSLYGFLGGNKEAAHIEICTLPYLYEHFFKKGYIPEPTFSKLLEYYDHVRRYLIKGTGTDLWKFKGLYDWKKPNIISETVFNGEHVLALSSISWTPDEKEEKIKAYLESLPVLPADAEPKREPSFMEQLLQKKPQAYSDGGTNVGSIGGKRQFRKKKVRKKKHKDNRKRGSKKKKRK